MREKDEDMKKFDDDHETGRKIQDERSFHTS